MKKILIILTSFMLIAGLGSHAYADKYKNASYEKIQKDADNGNLNALFALAKAYDTGTKGVIVNKDKARELYESAAEQGHESAQLSLGIAYMSGKTYAKKNYKKAKKWLTKAAEQDNATAEKMLSALYGYDGIKSQKKKFFYTKKTAERGDGMSALGVANMYLKGEGVSKNPSEAVTWSHICTKLLTKDEDAALCYITLLVAKKELTEEEYEAAKAKGDGIVKSF
ncbi:MAG: tetratricopeptide repeat protein [Pseudomonadota bacterium]